MNLDTDLTFFTNINTNWIIDLIAKHKIIKHKVRENLKDLRLDKDFVDTTPKEQSMKETTDELDCINLRCLICEGTLQSDSTIDRLEETICKRYI